MDIIVNGSSSSGNQYLLVSKEEVLAIEAGIPLKEVKKSLDFNLSSVSGVIVTHSHGDHSKYLKDYAKAGIDVYASSGTLGVLKADLYEYQHRIHAVYERQYFMVGSFKVMPFKVKHDCPEPDPFGYLIQHEEMGVCLFITDSYYCPYKFKGLNQIIIEANFCEDILFDNLSSGKVHQSVGSRVRESHMEIKILKDLLRANDLTAVNNILLIHLSSQNSDSVRFQKEIHDQTQKSVWIAEKGLRIPFNSTPF